LGEDEGSTQYSRELSLLFPTKTLVPNKAFLEFEEIPGYWNSMR
jgi:hypothetical protein